MSGRDGGSRIFHKKFENLMIRNAAGCVTQTLAAGSWASLPPNGGLMPIQLTITVALRDVISL